VRRLAAIAAGVLLSLATVAAQTLSLRDFTARTAAAITAKDAGAQVVQVEDGALRVESREWSGTLFLTKSYDEYRAHPAEAATVIDAFVRLHLDTVASATGATPETRAGWPDVSHWLPALRTRAWLTASEARLSAAGVPRDTSLGLVVPLNDALVSVLVEDRPDSTRVLGPADVARAGLSVDAARRTALDNLRTLRPRMPLEGRNGRFRVAGTRGFEASLALDEAYLRGQALGLHGDPVVAMPSADLIFITDTSSPDALLGLRAVVARLFAEAGASGLSAELFVWRRGQLEILPVP
jgi:hypothetical protein